MVIFYQVSVFIVDKIRTFDINKAQCLFFANCAYFVKTMTKLTVLKRVTVLTYLEI